MHLQVTGSTRHVDANELQRWIDRALPGDRLIYATGNILRDAYTIPTSKNLLHATRCAAWRAYEDGAVSLVQRVVSQNIEGHQDVAYMVERRRDNSNRFVN